VLEVLQGLKMLAERPLNLLRADDLSGVILHVPPTILGKTSRSHGHLYHFFDGFLLLKGEPIALRGPAVARVKFLQGR
jgi:hypothetical protein